MLTHTFHVDPLKLLFYIGKPRFIGGGGGGGAQSIFLLLLIRWSVDTCKNRHGNAVLTCTYNRSFKNNSIFIRKFYFYSGEKDGSVFHKKCNCRGIHEKNGMVSIVMNMNE